MAAARRSNARVYFFAYGGQRKSGTSKLILSPGAIRESLAFVAAGNHQERCRRVAMERQERRQFLDVTRMSRRTIEAMKPVLAAALGVLVFRQPARGVGRTSRESGVSDWTRALANHADQPAGGPTDRAKTKQPQPS